MSQYIKDGIIYKAVKRVILGDMQIFNPSEGQILEAGYEIYTEPESTEEELLALAKENKISEIIAYGDEDELNSYIALGITIRLPLELRLRLRNVIDSKKVLGETSLTEYYEGNTFTYPITAWDLQLTQYENYLYEVACATEQHKLNVQSLTTIDDVNGYDYTTGYPTQLNFDTDDRTDEEILADVITAKVNEVTEYADSDELNSYVAQGITIRLPLELRLRLRNVIDAKIALGETSLTEWYEGHSYTYPLTLWDSQLSQYENYLYEVSCNAEQHKMNIKALTTVDDVDAYDYTTGYPSQLVF